MIILAIAAYHLMPDRSTGDLRFFELLKHLAHEHKVLFCTYDTTDWISDVEICAYRMALERSGVSVRDGNPIAAIRSEPIDAILFEYYNPARIYIDEARFWQPTASILIDSVDGHFNRLLAKAQLTQARKDYAFAQEVKTRELTTYKKADIVITVSEEDTQILHAAMHDVRVEIIPLIHAVPPLAEGRNKISNSLLFVGNFHHHPNVDAMLYFCE